MAIYKTGRDDPAAGVYPLAPTPLYPSDRDYLAVFDPDVTGEPGVPRPIHQTTVLDHIKDDAWVRDGGQGWLNDNKRLWFLAEHDGWMHLYTVDVSRDGAAPRQLTSGRFEL